MPDAPEVTDPTPDAPNPVRDIYDVTGRARPQKIEPKAVEQKAAEQVVAADAPVAEDAEAYAPRTTIFPRADGSVDAGDTTTRTFDPIMPDTAAPGAAGAGAVAGAGSRPISDGDYGTVRGDTETALLGAASADAGYPDIDGEPGSAATPRGTLDLGLLLLRVLVGVILILRGAQTLFGFGGDPGIDALQGRLTSFTGADILAVGVPVALVVGGGLLLLGLATPVGGAVTLVAAGFMALFELSLSEAGYWPYQMSQSAQYWAILAALGLVLVFTGPGRYSADVSRGWATRPRASAWLWTVIGVGAAVGLWLVAGGGNPL